MQVVDAPHGPRRVKRDRDVVVEDGELHQAALILSAQSIDAGFQHVGDALMARLGGAVFQSAHAFLVEDRQHSFGRDRQTRPDGTLRHHGTREFERKGPVSEAMREVHRVIVGELGKIFTKQRNGFSPAHLIDVGALGRGGHECGCDVVVSRSEQARERFAATQKWLEVTGVPDVVDD